MASQMTKVGDDIFVSRPTESISGSATQFEQSGSPDLVVLTGWMDGSLKHLAKYSDAYRLIFPAATLCIIRTRQSSFYFPSTKALSPIKTVFAPLENKGTISKSITTTRNPRVLVHCFSNGGIQTLKTVDEVLRTSNTKGIDAKAIVFDSCPGAMSLPIMVRAFTAPITKSRTLKFLASILVTFAYATGGLVNFILRKPNAILALSQYLNKTFSSPRLYIYSKEDLLVPHEAVEAHAVAASDLGVDVTLEEFKGTAHVSHIRTEENAKRYWGAVEALWKKAVAVEGGEESVAQKLE